MLFALSIGCFESAKYYQEGEKLPSDANRPCEMCYCIKGFRKCVIKKCAPLIRGCTPKVPKEGNCCPTSYDCSRSLKVPRQVQQVEEDEPEEENDSIDFFSLLFGSDDPPEETSTAKEKAVEVTTLQPFKALPSTEKSFFDLIRAGLEIIDANADKIDSSINDVVTTPTSIIETTARSSTEKLTTTSRRPESTTVQLPKAVSASRTESTTLPTPKLTTTVKTPSTTNTASTAKSTTAPGMEKFSLAELHLSQLVRKLFL